MAQHPTETDDAELSVRCLVGIILAAGESRFCHLDQGHDGPHRTLWRGDLRYWLEDRVIEP